MPELENILAQNAIPRKVYSHDCVDTGSHKTAHHRILFKHSSEDRVNLNQSPKFIVASIFMVR